MYVLFSVMININFVPDVFVVMVERNKMEIVRNTSLQIPEQGWLFGTHSAIVADLAFRAHLLYSGRKSKVAYQLEHSGRDGQKKT